MVLVSSMIQSGLQAVLRPGVWVPGIRDLHRHRESWRTKIPARDFMKLTLTALETLIKSDTKGTYYDIHKLDEQECFIRILVFTWAEWLDVVEIQFYDNQAEVYSFSSGFLPVCVPFAFVLNAVLCFIPFSDLNLNKERIDQLRRAMGIDIEVN
ncbi:uncharacterized protein LOC135476800 [Liolophura sinensis]|uniref:uncharacterized protein LOC135476800 n=1 Tax=Liolophura sinensis TaxID=3198878 RepID=UPI00315865E8